jgi:glycosyltransferase involved in cell wall biosynthesis
VPESLSIAQVTPFPWEEPHEVNAYVRALSDELAARGHRVVVLAPSRDPELVRASRRRIRAGELFDASGEVSVLGVGELLPLAPNRRGVAPAPPMDIARTIEQALTTDALDIVQVHEPFAPSASSVALRHSCALNVGTFHALGERVLSTQVARRFVELFFGRLDGRVASFAATRDVVRHYFPADYRVILPGASPPQAERPAGPVRIAFVDQEERAALRLFLRALRALPDELDWEATVLTRGAAPLGALRSRLRQRVELVEDGLDELLARADVVVCASGGQAPAPGILVRAVGAGAVPIASRLEAYEEVLEHPALAHGEEGIAGLLFEPGELPVLSAQLERAIGDAQLRERLVAEAAPLREQLSWSRVADETEALYAELVARRHDPDPRPEVRRRVRGRALIDVDLHMHTDHSHDCATPVDVLLSTARQQGLGAIAVTDHNEVSGALEAAERAERFGVKVIVAEEIKTGGQGEVIGLFLQEKIPRGLTLDETIAAIRRQGGLVYVPHPFDRLHTVPDYEHLMGIVDDIDALEVFNPRVAVPAFNEEAARFAAKYRIVAGAGSDSHVAQGLGSVRIRMRDFEGPEEFLESLRDADIVGQPSSLYYVQVQALKFLQTRVARKR